MDRRKFPRANYKCKIRIKIMGEEPETISTQTENIGMGGICVVLKKGFNLFQNVELELILDDGASAIKCRGSIVWMVKKIDASKAVTYDMGIGFDNIREADRDRIGEIVEKIASCS